MLDEYVHCSEITLPHPRHKFCTLVEKHVYTSISLKKLASLEVEMMCNWKGGSVLSVRLRHFYVINGCRKKVSVCD
jgi:hypothetical protein